MDTKKLEEFAEKTFENNQYWKYPLAWVAVYLNELFYVFQSYTGRVFGLFLTLAIMCSIAKIIMLIGETFYYTVMAFPPFFFLFLFAVVVCLILPLLVNNNKK